MALVFSSGYPNRTAYEIVWKDVLNLKFNNSKTYWIEKKSEKINLRSILNGIFKEFIRFIL